MALKVKARAKPKVKPKAKPRVAMRVGALRRGLRRPAADGALVGAPVSRELWSSGEEVDLHQIPLEEFGQGVKVVFTKASYYTAGCKIAGLIKGITVDSGRVHILVNVTGTTSEGLLRLCSGQPRTELRCHRCPPECAGDAVSDDLAHVLRGRLMKEKVHEEGWVHNLEKVEAADDELADLRAREDLLLRGGGSGAGRTRGEEKAKEDVDKKKEKGKKKKEKKGKKRKRSRSAKSGKSGKKERKAKSRHKSKSRKKSSSTGSGSSRMNGRRPRSSAVKSLSALFRGTGLDPREEIRKRVARKARRVSKKSKVDKSNSSTESQKSGGTTSEDEGAELNLFDPETRLQRIGDITPGALCAQALMKMRLNLLQAIGTEDRPGALQPIALAYYRQQLQRRAAGPMQRELITLSAALDALLKGAPSKTADILAQRIKSIETTMAGSHWSVSQRLELAPQEGQVLADQVELSSAQKDAHAESKLKYLSTLPDGRRSKGKGQEKGKESGDFKREKGKNKGQSKGDKGRAKEDVGAK